MSKKAQGLSLNVVIIAILGLLVLGVLLYFVFGVFQGADSDTNCPSKHKGVCVEEDSCKGTIIDDACGDTGLVCCKLIG